MVRDVDLYQNILLHAAQPVWDSQIICKKNPQPCRWCCWKNGIHLFLGFHRSCSHIPPTEGKLGVDVCSGFIYCEVSQGDLLSSCHGRKPRCPSTSGERAETTRSKGCPKNLDHSLCWEEIPEQNEELWPSCTDIRQETKHNSLWELFPYPKYR